MFDTSIFSLLVFWLGFFLSFWVTQYFQLRNYDYSEDTASVLAYCSSYFTIFPSFVFSPPAVVSDNPEWFSFIIPNSNYFQSYTMFPFFWVFFQSAKLFGENVFICLYGTWNDRTFCILAWFSPSHINNSKVKKFLWLFFFQGIVCILTVPFAF